MRVAINALLSSFIGCLIVIFLSCTSQLNDQNTVSALDTKSPLFQKIHQDHSHIDFVNEIVENERINILNYLYYYNGSGVAVGDVNSDGLADLYFGSTVGKNKLYLNKGDLEFEDISLSAGVEGGFGITTGVSFIDINNDGHLDLYICKSGMHTEEYRTNQLFINNGDLTFTEQASLYGLDDHSFSSQAYFFDMDSDSDLDMYLVNHPIDWPNINKIMTGDQIMDGFDYQFSDKLYENHDGIFKDVTQQAGILNRSWGLSAAIGDFNDDELPDIYVANDFIKPDNLYINNGDGTFTDQILDYFRHISFYSMGSDFADVDNDGRNDLFVADMAMKNHQKSKRNMASMSTENFNTIASRGYHYPYSINTLQYNTGHGDFVDISQAAGVDKTDWSWAPLLADFDNDGYKDIFITNGIYRDIIDNDFLAVKADYDLNQEKNYYKDLVPLIPTSKVHNHVFKNNADYTFEDLSKEWGLEGKTNSNGAAYADLDNDGDLDLIINNLNETSQLYENKSNVRSANTFVRVKLKGPKSNGLAIGAQLMVYYEGKTQRRDMYTHRGFMSSVDPVIHFGLGSDTRLDSLIVIWPDKKKTLLLKPDVNEELKIDYEDASQESSKSIRYVQHLVEDITDDIALAHFHIDPTYNDFDKELLLPHKLSQSGPHVSVADVNQDGLEDFYIGGAKGQSASLYLQQINGSFTNQSNDVWSLDKKYEDIGSHFFDFDGDGDLDLYVISGSIESVGIHDYQDRLYENDGDGNYKKNTNALPSMQTSGAVVESLDFDGDGDLDLAIANRVIPGSYPLSPKSFLLENRNGIFEDVTTLSAPELDTLGMVTALKPSDIDRDGDLDLVIVGEWMGINILENKNGTFVKSNQDRGIENTEGWWQSVEIYDIDGDGDEDIIAGNIGANNKYKPSIEQPLWIYYADFDKNGSGDIVLSKETETELLPVRGRECSSQQMPFISDKFPDYTSYASASLVDIYGSGLIESAFKRKAVEFRSHIFINNGDGKYQKRTLPGYAQMSPINGILVKDINGDRVADMIIAGNMLTPETETVRYDAGHGLVMFGDETGGFKGVHPAKSGLHLTGDVKDLEWIQLANGATGILVTQNDDKLRLLQLKSKDELHDFI